MKKMALAAMMVLGIIVVVLLPIASAAGTIYFSAINDTVLPLEDRTMPRYIDGRLYLPYSFFSSDELGVYFVPSSDRNTILIYSSVSKRLKFDVLNSTVFDQDGTQYFISARSVNGTVYVPAQMVCSYFGLTVSVIQTDLAPVVRVKSSSAILNDKTFVGYPVNKNNMQDYYDAYMGVPDTGTTPKPSTAPSVETTFNSVTVFLSFYDVSAGEFETILSTLSTSVYKCCFFLSADEIADNADLLRRAVGQGHVIGIWLDTGMYEEYSKASALLFEATKVKTFLVSSTEDGALVAATTAQDHGLIYWPMTHTFEASADITVSGVTSKLSVLSGSRESLCFACSDEVSTILYPVINYLRQHQYDVRRITETNAPTLTLD